MTLETIQTVEVAGADRMLQVMLVSGGEPWYQAVNYTVTGVEWHNHSGVFWFDMENRRRSADWFANVLQELENELDVRLQLDGATTWLNVPDEMKSEIELAIN